MSSNSHHRLFCAQAVRLLSLSALLCMQFGCSPTNEPKQTTDEELIADANETIVYVTDTLEWVVQLFKEHLFYSEAVETNLPAPWAIPTHEDAIMLRTLVFASPSGERFITSDGYTFGMPSASVSKAGAKTKYSVLGLHKRRTTIIIEW